MAGRGLTLSEIAVEFLTDAKRPVHISEITRHVLSRVTLRSETPEKSVNSALQKDPRVVRVGRGLFQIAKRGSSRSGRSRD